MIKINLLEVEKERKAKAVTPGGVPTVILLVLVFGAAAAAFIFYYFAISTRLSDLQKDVEQKRAKVKELEPYIKRVDELEARKAELEKKNRAIEQLRSQRTIPVHILDEVSRALPDYLWLDEMVIKGETIAIGGQTLQEQAIPTFMKNLNSSEFVGICRLIETRQTGAGQSTATTFKISAPITNPFKPKEPEPAKKTTKPAAKK